MYGRSPVMSSRRAGERRRIKEKADRMSHLAGSWVKGLWYACPV